MYVKPMYMDSLKRSLELLGLLLVRLFAGWLPRWLSIYLYFAEKSSETDLEPDGARLRKIIINSLSLSLGIL